MGTKRRDSDQRLRLRAKRDPDDRPTLLPCPYCDGRGGIMREPEPGRYRLRGCVFCAGLGAIDRQMMIVTRRWMKMLHHNRSRGRCES